MPSNSEERDIDGERRSPIGYQYAHKKVMRLRGRAADLTCEDCGFQASQWAYVPGDKYEQTETGTRMVRGVLKEWQRSWSSNPWAYAALCVPCHTRRDRGLS